MQQNQSCSCPYTNSLQPPMRLLNQEGGSDFLVFDNRGKERGDPGCRGKKGRTKEQEKQVKGRVGMDPHSLMRIHTQATLIPPAMQSQHAHHCILKGLVHHPGGRESRLSYHILLKNAGKYVFSIMQFQSASTTGSCTGLHARSS